MNKITNSQRELLIKLDKRLRKKDVVTAIGYRYKHDIMRNVIMAIANDITIACATNIDAAECKNFSNEVFGIDVKTTVLGTDWSSPEYLIIDNPVSISEKNFKRLRNKFKQVKGI